jgi:Mn-containing catalase
MRSDILAKTTEEFGHMEAIGATVHAIAAKLRATWPEADRMPYYPAFRQRLFE